MTVAYVVPEITVELAKSPRIIGLCGYMRSGKDTAAEALRLFGYERKGFADSLKEMVATLLRFQGADGQTIHRHLHGDARHIESPFLGGRTARHAMQSLGTEWGRAMMGPDFWLDVAMTAIEANPDKRFVIPDVRFPNEAERIRSMGGVIFRVVRPDLTPDLSHVSERLVSELPVSGELHNISPNPVAFAGYVQDEFLSQYAS